MKTKNRFFFTKEIIMTVLCLISTFKLAMSQLAQSPWYIENRDDSINFFDLVKNAELFYEANPQIKEIKGGDYKPFIRWQEFWKNRIYKGENTQTDYRYMLEAYSYLKQKNGAQKSLNDLSNWNLLGPTALPTQNLGIVVSLYVDPTNNNIIYAGTNASGLWKTINSGITWQNITDDPIIPYLGIEYVTGNPYNSDILYIA